MRYLIQHIWICLLIAALIGGIIGWLLRHLSCKRQFAELEARRSRPQNLASAAPVAAAAPVMAASGGTSSYDVEEIEGIGKGYGRQLRELGLGTTAELLDRCCTAEGQSSVAKSMNHEAAVVQSWASMADLLRVSGIDGQQAELLYWAGVKTTSELGHQDAYGLRSKIVKANEEQHRVENVASETEIRGWINSAKSVGTKMRDA